MITEDLIPGKKTSWFDVEKPDSQDFETLSEKFNLPYLLVQDTLRPEHLPKYEFTEEGHFFMLRAYDQESTDASITVQELTRKIAIFISEHRLVTIHRIHFECVDKISSKIKKNHYSWSIQKIIHEINEFFKSCKPCEMIRIETQNSSTESAQINQENAIENYSNKDVHVSQENEK
jgi:magnesium transporter